MAHTAFILSQFPRYDEAFILRELVELSKREGEITIFSLRPCNDKVVHAQAKALEPKTVYAPFVLSLGVWSSQLHFMLRRPGAYFGAIGWVVSRHWKNPVILAKNLLLFPKTAHFARIALHRGVTHLHAFWATYPATAAVVAERLTGIPYSLSGHAHDIYTVNPALAEKIQRARFVVTCTENNKEHLLSILNGEGRPEKIRVSYHGVDLKRFSPEPKNGQGFCSILSVGSLLPCKGYETLIEACRLLKQARFPFHCTIAGGGPLEPALRKKIELYYLSEEVTITGYVSQETVAGLYQEAHLFLLPLVSRIHWGIPNVLIEALATKTPVVSCDLPSLKELVEHGKTGWVIPEHDPEALQSTVQMLWKETALRGRLADEGYRRVVEKFSIELTGAKLRDLFETGT